MTEPEVIEHRFPNGSTMRFNVYRGEDVIPALEWEECRFSQALQKMVGRMEGGRDG